VQYNCAVVNNQCTKGIVVQGTAVTAPAGATVTYNVYRNGVLKVTGLTYPGWWDFDLTVGAVNTYLMTTVINGAEGLATNWPPAIKVT
jgi:hypothetical protein